MHSPLRISRRMSLEIGISAAELTHAMTRSPSPKKRALGAAAANPTSATSQPVTSSNSCPAVPTASRTTTTDKENTTATMAHLSPALQRAAVGEKRKYSPLSSRSLYNLTTSPIINRSLNEGPSDQPPPAKRPRCKASKKLY